MGWRKIRYCPVKARHVARYVKRLAVSAAFCIAHDALAAEPSRYPAGQSLAQANAESSRGTTAEIQNIQRLLKLLADRYPGKYATVDPGRIDGAYRPETQDAIRNFERISATSAARSNDRLVANILATLAQLSATQPAETGTERSGTGDSPTAAANQPPAAEPKAEAPTSAGEDGKEVSAATAAPASAPAKAPQVAPAAPNRNRNVFFVQAASLKSLEAAKREWRRIFEENRAALKGEQVYFERASIADRGTFFRILIGPIEERDAARTLCSFLKQNDQTCVVTMRNLAELSKSAAPASPAAAPQADTASEPAKTPAAPAAADALPPTPAPVTAPTASSTGADTDGAPAAPSDQPKAGATEPAEAPTASPGREPARPENSGGDSTIADRAGNSDTAVAAATPAEMPKEPAAAASPRPRGAAIKAETALLPSEPAVRPAEINAGAEKTPAPPVAGRAPAPSPSAGALAVARLIDQLRGYGAAAGLVAAAAVIAGIAVYGWRRRNRQSMLAQIIRPASYAFAPAPASGAGPLGDLESDFESEPLRQSRVVRDEFLRGILGPESDEQAAARPEDSAIRINSSLKALLVQEPARYKSIFLNWIFLSKVGAALNKKEITIEQLSDRINREFDLLQTYFKIHLLELDDRHHIRMELPGLFYCLQLSQMKKRQHSAAFSTA